MSLEFDFKNPLLDQPQINSISVGKARQLVRLRAHSDAVMRSCLVEVQCLMLKLPSLRNP